MIEAITGAVATYYPNQYYEKQVGGGADKIIKYYYAGASRIAERENGTLAWIITDHLGSTTALANEDGTLKTLMRYTAYGEIRAAYGSGEVTDYRYTGQRSEGEVGLYWYTSRMYDPALGRFIQPDSIIPDPGSSKGFDRYAYVNNNPVNFNDPSGHRFSDVNDSVEKAILSQTYQANAQAASVHTSIQLNVSYIEQPEHTSCGEAAFTASWNYQHPNNGQDVNDVYEHASNDEYYVPQDPFTSPEGMQNLAGDYADAYGTSEPIYGNVTDSETGASTLLYQLHKGNPIIIDASTWIGHPGETTEGNDSHFILVTGYDSTSDSFTYVDSFGYDSTTGTHSAGIYTDKFSHIWKSWSENSDRYLYGGSGWYLVVQ